MIAWKDVKKQQAKWLYINDGWRGYNALVDVGYSRHFRVNYGHHEFARDGHCTHINAIESSWSPTKRRLAKYGVSVNFEPI